MAKKDEREKTVGNAMGTLLMGLNPNALKRTDNNTVKSEDELDESIQTAISEIPVAIRENFVNGFHIEGAGLSIAEWVDKETWEQFGFFLKHVRVVWDWFVADWLAFGNHRYGDKVYDYAAELFGKAPRTWEDYAYIARNVRFSERSENLPPLLHKPVAAYNDNPDLQRELIQLAETHKLSKELFEVIIPLYLDGKSYSHLLPSQITPIERANIKEDKHRLSILKRAKGKTKKQWLAYAQKQAEEWAKVADAIEGRDD
jgi:hypothetical protein